MAILITGGAGYIGSHAVKMLHSRGEQIIVYDNLSTGHRESVPENSLIEGDLHETEKLANLMREREVSSVLHFAAKSQVAESMRAPGLYYYNNVGGTLSLLEAMVKADVKLIVFSSSASVYGKQDTVPITEDAKLHPESVYGTTKYMIEKMLEDFDMAHGIKAIALRYFNVAGADPSGEIGEAHDPETHLIPCILRHLLGLTEEFILYGMDYPTRDGTCVRDYVEIGDLVEAHYLALKALRAGAESGRYNLGSGMGFTNLEILRTAERVTGKKAKVSEHERRPGDPATLIASSEKFIAQMGWNPGRNNLEEIIKAAWKWHSSHPNGYCTAAGD